MHHVAKTRRRLEKDPKEPKIVISRPPGRLWRCLWEASGRVWEASGTVFGVLGGILGALAAKKPSRNPKVFFQEVPERPQTAAKTVPRRPRAPKMV